MAPPSFFLFAPQGAGKTRNAQQIAELLGCTTVVDDWRPGLAVPAGALVLTNQMPGEAIDALRQVA
jgi:hypothetical protein